MAESREDELSFLQTDEINGSQSNQRSREKTAKELVEYSKISGAEEGGHLIFNATPDMMLPAEAVDLPVAENLADRALVNSKAGGQRHQFRIDHQLPVQSVQVTSSPKEHRPRAGDQWQNKQ